MSEASSRSISWRVVAGVLLLAALVVFGVMPYYVTFLVDDRVKWHSLLEQFPDRRAPGYRELLREADARIPRGERVAIVFPTLEWPRGYSYAFFRAEYLLAGRVIVPLSWWDGPAPERIAEAEYIVVYGAGRPSGRWERLFQNGDGEVARRIR
ncbi:MAG: hypothetical protein HYU52_15000 [Acidobacteria bacterium]|nr:hypothetical protein [Acidobacteriota bacterium]